MPKGESAWLQDNSTDWDRDGCLDLTEDEDDDNDGVNDMDLNGTMLDLCPQSTIGAAVDEFGCAADQRDTDGDGVVDATDLCSGTRHPPQPMHRAVKTWTVMGFICKTTGVHPVPRVGPSMRTVAPCPIARALDQHAGSTHGVRPIQTVGEFSVPTLSGT